MILKIGFSQMTSYFMMSMSMIHIKHTKSYTIEKEINTHPREKIPNKPDYKTFIPHFASKHIDTIKKDI